MKEKKIRKFIFIIILFIILLILIFLFLKLNQEQKENTQCKIIDKLELDTKDEVPSLKSFSDNCQDSGTIEFYENDEKITLETLKAGTYQVKIIIDEQTYYSTLIVNTIVLELQDVTINEGTSYDINAFVKNCSSKSGECQLNFANSEMENYKDAGTYDIEIIAKDDHSETRNNAKLTIIQNEDNPSENNSNNNIPASNNTNDRNNNENTHNNNTSNTNTTNNNPVTKVNTISEETRSNSYKYGTTITTITTTYYDVYSDNSRQKINETSRTEYNYSTYNGDTTELKPEALTLVSNHMTALNEVVSYVNQYRSELGVSNITLDYDLSVAATIRALEMGWANKFSHTRPDGTTCFTVVDELGISYYTVGENIAMGYNSPREVTTGWRNSQGHYENMVNANFNKIGVGLVIINGTHYWVQLFTN